MSQRKIKINKIMKKEKIIEGKLNEHIRLLNSGHYKVCDCNIESAWFYDFGMYKCQYCGGALTDFERVRKIIKYNTPLTNPK